MRKLTKTEVAARAGIPINTFIPYWNGDRAMRLGDFVAVLNALDVEGEEACREIKGMLASGKYLSE